MGHVKYSLLLLSCFCIGSASVGQTTNAAKAKRPVATVNGQAIYDEDLAASAEGKLLSLRNQEYEIKKKALDGLIEQKLLETVASKQGLTTEKLLAREVDSKVSDPSDTEIEGYYLDAHDALTQSPEILI